VGGEGGSETTSRTHIGIAESAANSAIAKSIFLQFPQYRQMVDAKTPDPILDQMFLCVN